MNALDILKNELYGKVYTENGDVAYTTTNSKNVDFFGIAGALRYNPSHVLNLFKEAINEDFDLAILNLFYLRDVRGGLGERNAFRVCFQYLCDEYPNIAKVLFDFVVEYGRYDDLFVAKDTKVEKELISYIKNQLLIDIQNKQENGTCSLLAKWLPSINASNTYNNHLGLYFANRLGYSKAEYRKLCSYLRKDMIIENNLREKDYTFEYENVPGKALYKYKKAFIRNDLDRYREFIHNVNTGNVEMKTKTVFPYEIIKEYRYDMSELEKEAMNARWNSIDRNNNLENTIVVRDGSGSMTCMNGLPMYIATSMAILCSEQLNDEFKNRFITFSSRPELITLPDKGSLYDKLNVCYQYYDWTNTDIQKVYDLIYNTSLKIKDPKNYIKKIIIISDMEFDRGTANVPTYESMEEKFEKANIPLPSIVYWNVNARKVHFASNTEHKNVQYVSGASTSVIDSIMNGKDLDANMMMLKTIEKYKKIIDRLKGVTYDKN